MTTKTLLKTTGLIILMMVLITFFTNAQIAVQGLAVDHEGTAVWDADGTGPEPAAIGHIHPYGWGTCRYYGASRDYIDTNPDAALCHFLDDISGFPLFIQALADHGFNPGQVKMKTGLLSLKNDIEGEDWFTFNDSHYFNYYDAWGLIEVNNEPMVSFYVNHYFDWIASTSVSWNLQSNFSKPFDASGSSSTAVQEVAAAFLADLNGQELRLVVDDLQSVEAFGTVNGRINGNYHEIVSGYLEKGLPMLPFHGLYNEHQGIAGWDADGSGPEPEAYGHTFEYGGTNYWMAYYTASPDYDGIDPDPNAALCQVTGEGTGFPNLAIQMAYRGFTLDQFKVKSGLSILGNDEEDVDWGLNENTHWYRHYGTPVTFEIAGEPILEYMIDTNYTEMNLDDPNLMWLSNASFSPVKDISGSASTGAQYVALSLFKDIGDRFIGTHLEGHGMGNFTGNGRDGAIHQIDNGYITLGDGCGTYVAAGEASGTWEVENSPYMIEGNLLIPNGETLEIKAGVKVAFRGPYHIQVNGCVKAIGEIDNKIIFTHSNPGVWWDGFGYSDTPSTNDSSLFNYCLFEYGYAQGNEPSNSGGVFAVMNFDKFKFTNCIFQHNRADQPGSSYQPTGGAIALWNSSPMIQNCIFRYNYAEVAGGALFAYEYSEPIISGCLFYENETPYFGGAVGFYQNSNGIILNSTIADNNADVGGALAFYDNSSPEIINTILWNNEAVTEGDQVYLNDISCSPGFYYCNIEDSIAGFGGVAFTGDYLFNLAEDPLFNDPPYYPEYSVSDESPCIDAGTPDTSAWYYPQYLPYSCLCGNLRIQGGCIDMGCYEKLATGINDLIQLSDLFLNIYPNPINISPTIEFYLEENAFVQLSFIDVHGKIVYSTEFSGIHIGNNQYTFNAKNLPAGVYFCRLLIGKEMATRKVIKLE
ncbi:MAG: T9SS type A sorting domain-containing protein [Bacteroidales bacterium]|nr:T9SS type A sorting domain-containing protein [Bacteroidales bacterium]